MALDATVQAKFDELKAEVTAESTGIVASVKTLLDGLSAQIAALKAAGGANPSPELVAAIDNLETAVKANRDALAAAVVANSPAQ